jgi:rhamnopyranosyl-N-acetylglucosaminyl-diphospho-decaprenol beta-1,3/1,4-galactofuranosyltransferase
MDIMTQPNITAIVVTYNRKRLLLESLASLKSQSLPLMRIIVIDNASTDKTKESLSESGWLDSEFVTYSRLNKNTGGAGGFSYGLAMAISQGADWIWMMDDDAMPHIDALAGLMKVANDPRTIYGSTPVFGDILSWRVTAIASDGKKYHLESAIDMPDETEVDFLPFLGILIHRQLVEKIGLPDPGFFIAADDVEYTVRAKKIGAKLIQVGKSRIKHPPASKYQIHVLGHTIYCLRLPPWKRYYDTRNRLLLARKHYGKRLYTETIPGSFVRLFGALLYEPQKACQLWAFIAGSVDGLMGYKGLRHPLWRIPL